MRESTDRDVDVVIVGAGLSGMTAAYELYKAGISFIVAEARDRMGGKTWSVAPFRDDRKVDLGAAWINDTTQSAVHALATALGLELVQQNTTGDVIIEDIDGTISTFAYGGTPASLSEAGGVEDMLRIRELADSMSQEMDLRNVGLAHKALDQYTVRDWALGKGASETALASVSVWTRAMLGLEASEVNALFFLNYCRGGGGLNRMRSDQRDGGQYLRFAQGSQELSIGLAKLVPKDAIMLATPVQSIEEMGSTMRVLTSQGYLFCKRVIVSLPTPLYSSVRFEPPLPLAKTKLSEQNVTGYTNKVHALYATPWWRAAGLCGLIQSFVGPITVTRDSSVDKTGQYSLTCFLVGQLGRDLARVPQKERFAAVLSHIQRTFGTFVEVPQPTAMAEYEWAKDDWAQGCPCPAPPPGTTTSYEPSLRTPHGRIHFIGTETAFEWKGYMDGAVRSGVRGAQEVLEAFASTR